MLWFKRIILTALLATAGGILIWGPRQGVKAPEGFTVVTYWEKWTGKEADQMKEIVDDFNRTVGQERKIFVNYLSMSSINEKTLVATAAGSPPDIAGLWDYQVAQFAALDAIEPLDAMAADKGIKDGYYKKVYWEGCRYNNKLFALVSTPAAVALHYNKQIFQDRADALRAAGLDPSRPPATLDELDRYAQAIDVIETGPGGSKNIKVAGYLPLEPGWFLNVTGYWFGAKMFDEEKLTVSLDAPEMVAAMEWIRSYSQRLGPDSMSEFRSGFGGFNSTQNPFLSGTVAMEQQGPWLANFIENLKPEMNRWHVPKEKLARETAFADLKEGMSLEQVRGVLGAPESDKAGQMGRRCVWDAGIKSLTVVFVDDRATSLSMKLLPAAQRKQFCQWGAAPFPAANGVKDVSYAGFDILTIPKGAKHKQEAFEFIAYVNRQDVMEKLCALHCKNSPLTQVSDDFKANHPNPYIDVFEQLASSTNARAVPKIPIWPEIEAEMNAAVQGISLLKTAPQTRLAQVQAKVAHSYERFVQRQRARGLLPPSTEGAQ